MSISSDSENYGVLRAILSLTSKRKKATIAAIAKMTKAGQDEVGYAVEELEDMFFIKSMGSGDSRYFVPVGSASDPWKIHD